MKAENLYYFIIKFLVALFIIISMATIFTKVDVKGQEDVAKARSDYYHELEGRYKAVLKYSLEEKGMYNAGINITSVINADGSRVYSVSIHHEKFETFDDVKKSDILASLSSITFADNETPVSLDFF